MTATDPDERGRVESVEWHIDDTKQTSTPFSAAKTITENWALNFTNTTTANDVRKVTATVYDDQGAATTAVWEVTIAVSDPGKGCQWALPALRSGSITTVYEVTIKQPLLQTGDSAVVSVTTRSRNLLTAEFARKVSIVGPNGVKFDSEVATYNVPGHWTQALFAPLDIGPNDVEISIPSNATPGQYTVYAYILSANLNEECHRKEAGTVLWVDDSEESVQGTDIFIRTTSDLVLPKDCSLTWTKEQLRTSRDDRVLVDGVASSFSVGPVNIFDTHVAVNLTTEVQGTSNRTLTVRLDHDPLCALVYLGDDVRNALKKLESSESLKEIEGRFSQQFPDNTLRPAVRRYLTQLLKNLGVQSTIAEAVAEGLSYVVVPPSFVSALAGGASWALEAFNVGLDALEKELERIGLSADIASVIAGAMGVQASLATPVGPFIFILLIDAVLGFDGYGQITIAVPNSVWAEFGETRNLKTLKWLEDNHTEFALENERNAQLFAETFGVAATLIPGIGHAIMLGEYASVWFEEDFPTPQNPLFTPQYRNCTTLIQVPWNFWMAPYRGIMTKIPLKLSGDEYIAVTGDFSTISTWKQLANINLPFVRERGFFEIGDVLGTGNLPPTCNSSQFPPSSVPPTPVPPTPGTAPSITASPSALVVPEGGSASFSVQLHSQPTSNVSVRISGQSGTDLTVSPASLSFSPTNWNSAKAVRVDARQDTDTDLDPFITLVHTPSGGNYTGIPAENVVVIIEEDDVAPEGVTQPPIGVGPDLVVSLSASETTVEPGDSFGLNATVRNQGDADAASTTLHYYRSTDSVINTGDTEVGTDSVGALPASKTGNESVTLSSPATAGTYYYGACVDPVPNEANTFNNCSAGVPVTVAGKNTRVSRSPDEDVLMALYNATGGPNWSAQQGWMSSSPIGRWRGVVTDANGNVIQLFLDGYGLDGPIPPELGNLSNLERLSLQRNQLTGNIPPELGNLTKLTVLRLYGNRLTGCAPAALEDVSDNDLTLLGLPFCNVGVPPPPTSTQNGDRVYVNGGTLNGQPIANASPTLTVEAGQSITGTVDLTVHNDHVASARFPVVATPTWGDHESSYWRVPVSAPAFGSIGGAAQVNLTAPATPGEYAIIFVAQAETTGGHVASATHWTSGSPQWDNGDDVAGWNDAAIDFAIGNGYVLAPQHGWSQANAHFGAAAIKVVVTAGGTVEPRGADHDVLVALYNATDGPNWRLQRRWLSSDPIGDWLGVTTDANGNVTQLVLNRYGLNGPIPPELGNLTSLNRLVLDNNRLTELPPEIGNLSNLTSLFINYSELGGQIPPELGNLTDLDTLTLTDNRLTGEIPPKLGNLTNLTRLRLSGNRLTGCVPATLRDVRGNDFASLGLPFCDDDPPPPGRTGPLNGNRVHLTGGTLNGQRINTSSPSITVSAGAAITGTVGLDVHKDQAASAVFPVEATPTWGDHLLSYWRVPISVPAFSSAQGDAPVNLTAPDTPGEYAIIFVAQAELSGGYVASATHWASGRPRWDDGDDVAGWDDDTIDFAIDNGYVRASQYGWTQPIAHFGAAAIKVVVTAAEEGPNCLQGILCITRTLVEHSDAAASIRQEFGEDWVVADWNDLKRLWPQHQEELKEFFPNGARLNVDGNEQRGSSGRWYFVEDHNGSRPGFFAAHDELGGHEISLGSWFFDEAYYLAIESSDEEEDEEEEEEEETEGPDLVVESPSADESSVDPEETFTLSVTVRNQGGEESDSTTLRYYRSTDSTISTRDTELDTDDVRRLRSERTGDESMRVDAPADSGTYYFGACVDPVADESNTQNNCSDGVAVIVLDVDLVVQSASASESRVELNEPFEFSVTVRNQGAGESDSSNLRYYRSTDSTIDTGDTELITVRVSSLDPGESDDELETLDAPVTAGTYYYGACVDLVPGESDIRNNCSTGVEITVVAGDPEWSVNMTNLADNILGTGVSFTLSATVSNYGAGDAASTNLRYYRSTDSFISTSDTQVGGTDTVGALGVNETEDHSESLTTPDSSGTYYYGACVETVPGESFASNDCSVGMAIGVGNVTPDLEVYSHSVYDKNFNPGHRFGMVFWIRNLGTGPSPTSQTAIRYYRSDDSTISSSDTELFGNRRSGTGRINPSSEVKVEYRTRAHQSGTYYYGACIDVVARETVTDNNCAAVFKVIVN